MPRFLTLGRSMVALAALVAPAIKSIHELLPTEPLIAAKSCSLKKQCFVNGLTEDPQQADDLEYWRFQFVAFAADYVLASRRKVSVGGFKQLRKALTLSGAKFVMWTEDNKVFRFYIEPSSSPDELNAVLTALRKYSIIFLKAELDPVGLGLVGVSEKGEGVFCDRYFHQRKSI